MLSEIYNRKGSKLCLRLCLVDAFKNLLSYNLLTAGCLRCGDQPDWISTNTKVRQRDHRCGTFKVDKRPHAGIRAASGQHTSSITDIPFERRSFSAAHGVWKANGNHWRIFWMRKVSCFDLAPIASAEPPDCDCIINGHLFHYSEKFQALLVLKLRT